MVAIRNAHALRGPLPADGGALLARVPQAAVMAGSERVAAALDHLLRAHAGAPVAATRRRVSAALDIVETLAMLGLDADALVAGVLCQAGVADTVDDTVVRERFGESVSTLLEGVRRMDVLGAGTGTEAPTVSRTGVARARCCGACWYR